MSRDFSPQRVRLVVVALAIVLAGLVAPILPAHAQAPSATGTGPVLARVEGRPITLEDYNRVAVPYFQRLEEQFGGSITDEVRDFAKRSALNELIRRELLIVEAQRRQISVSEAETDRVLMTDPLFHADGQFDRAKFVQYKINPNTNYLTILPRLRELAAANKLDSLLRAEFRPSSRQVRTEWSKRNARVQFSFFAITPRDVPLEAEATHEERVAYYEAHPEFFERKPRARLRYLRFMLPPPGDPAYAAQLDGQLARGRTLADSLRAGESLDALAASPDEVLDTGLFDLPPVAIPGLGRIEELNVEVTKAVEAGTGETPVIGPIVTPTGVLVAVVAEHQAAELPPLVDVLASVKRRADADKRDRLLEERKRAFYASNRDRYRSPRATVVRASLSDLGNRARRPSASAVRNWYQDNGRSLFAGLEANAELPPLSDSLKAAITRRMMDAELGQKARRQLARLALDWRKGRDLDDLARRAKAEVETVTLVGDGGDPIFTPAYVDSLLSGRAEVHEGEIHGPRSFGHWAAVWRIEALDLDHVPPLDSLRARVDEDFRRDQQERDEARGRVFFEQHREDYRTKLRWIIDYIAFQIAPSDSIEITSDEMEAYYQAHRGEYATEEQVRARHILVSSDPTRTPGGEEAARARIDSLSAALSSGADFSELARRFSQDPGSAAKGGDLGFFARGRMVKEFSDTSFALPIGRISQPVKTTYGYHLIIADEHTPAGVRPFDEVRDDIERQLAESRADTLTRLMAAENLRRIQRGVVAAAIAAPYGGLITSAPFGAGDAVAGLGLVQGLDRDLATLRPGQWSDEVYRSGNAYVIARLVQRLEPGLAGFDEVKYQVVQDMKAVIQDSLVQARSAEIQQRLAAGADFDSVSRLYGGLKDSGVLAQGASFVPYLGNERRVVDRAFDLALGEVSDSIKTAQGYAWIRLDQKPVAEGETYRRDREAILQEMLLERYNEWIERTKKTMRIEILREEFQ